MSISGNVTGFLHDARYIVTDSTGSMLVYFYDGPALEFISKNSIVDSEILVSGEYVLDKNIRVIKVKTKENVAIL